MLFPSEEKKGSPPVTADLVLARDDELHWETHTPDKTPSQGHTCYSQVRQNRKKIPRIMLVVCDLGNWSFDNQ